MRPTDGAVYGRSFKARYSVNPLYVRLPLDEKIKTCEQVYARLDYRACFVPEPVADSPLTDDNRSAHAFDPTLVLGRRLERAWTWRRCDHLEMSHEDWFRCGRIYQRI